jgi:predicted nuclease with TOPRIM domain
MTAAVDLGTVTTVLGIAGIVGAAVAVLLTAGTRETLRLLRDDNGDLRGRITTLEDKENNCQSRLARIEAENAVLRDMVTGQSAIAALSEKIDAHYRDLRTRLDRH